MMTTDLQTQVLTRSERTTRRRTGASASRSTARGRRVSTVGSFLPHLICSHGTASSTRVEAAATAHRHHHSSRRGPPWVRRCGGAGDKAGAVVYGDATVRGRGAVPRDVTCLGASLLVRGRDSGQPSAPSRRRPSTCARLAERPLQPHMTAWRRNTHHILEGTFKAAARALRRAVERDPRVSGVPSTKGVL